MCHPAIPDFQYGIRLGNHEIPETDFPSCDRKGIPVLGQVKILRRAGSCSLVGGFAGGRGFLGEPFRARACLAASRNTFARLITTHEPP